LPFIVLHGNVRSQRQRPSNTLAFLGRPTAGKGSDYCEITKNH